MVTLREIAADIHGVFRANFKLTDSPDIRYVYFWVKNMRAKFIKQHLERVGNFFIEDANVQSLGAVAVVTVANPYTLGMSADAYVMRTPVLPKTIIQNNNLAGFTRIFLTEDPTVSYYTRLNREIPLVSHSRALTVGEGRFNKYDLYAFLHEDRIHVISKYDFTTDITEIGIKGIFLDPIEAGQVADPTYSVDSPYPISETILEDVKMAALQINYEIYRQQLDDKITDGENNLTLP